MTSKSMPAATLALLQQRYKCIRHLIHIDSSPETFWADGPLKEPVGGDLYIPREFRVAGITWGKLDQAGAKIIIDNRDSVVSNISYSQFATELILTIGILVKNDWTDDWEAIYEPISAEISDISGTAHSATVILSGMTGFGRRSGLRQCDADCRHIYGPDGGQRCQYAGAELTCDRKRSTCVARGNAVHFGGFVWALEPGETIKIAANTSQQLHGSSATRNWIQHAPATDEDEPYSDRELESDNVFDIMLDLPPVPVRQERDV